LKSPNSRVGVPPRTHLKGSLTPQHLPLGMVPGIQNYTHQWSDYDRVYISIPTLQPSFEIWWGVFKRIWRRVKHCLCVLHQGDTRPLSSPILQKYSYPGVTGSPSIGKKLVVLYTYRPFPLEFSRSMAKKQFPDRQPTICIDDLVNTVS